MPDSASTRRNFLTALAGGAVSAAAAEVRRPNIVFLLLDDLGWRDFGCYGNTFHETPALRPARQRGREVHQCLCGVPGLLAHAGQHTHR